MKSMFIKEYYMAKVCCRSYILVAAVFLAVALLGAGNMFFLFYPCLFCGMIPITLLAYDERSRFHRYLGTLPVSKKEYVLSLYLFGLAAILAAWFVMGMGFGIKSRGTGLHFADFTAFMLSVLAISCAVPAVTLPFIFKFGVEKGRIAYYVVIGVVCGLSAIISKLAAEKPETGIVFSGSSLVFFLAGMAVYAASAHLSAKIFSKKEF